MAARRAVRTYAERLYNKNCSFGFQKYCKKHEGSSTYRSKAPILYIIGASGTSNLSSTIAGSQPDAVRLEGVYFVATF